MSVKSRMSWKIFAAASSVIGVFVAAYSYWSPLADRDVLPAAQIAAERKDFQRVEQLCKRLLSREPHAVDALRLAAEAAAHLGEKERALEYLNALPDESAEGVDQLQFRRGELALELGKLTTAETSLRTAVSLNSQHLAALRRLCFVLRVEGRNWEAREFLQSLANLGPLGMDELFVLGSTEWVWLDGRDGQFLDYCLRAVPTDPLPMLGRVRQSLLREDVQSARRSLKAIVDVDPRIGEAQARLGVILAQGLDDAEFLEWNRKLPVVAEVHPGVWFARGLWLRRKGHIPDAIHCFGETVTRDPNHRGACSQLSQALGLVGEATGSEIFARRAKLLAGVEETLREIQQSPEMMRELVETLIDLGRDFEAAAWLKTAVTQPAAATWMALAKVRLTETKPRDEASINAFQRPFATLDWSRWPLPDWENLISSSATTGSLTEPDVGVEISFADVASTVGISFQYVQKTGLAAGVAYMYEFSGGGVGVLDLDADGWPDLYLTQGSGLPPGTTKKASPDKLFRNFGNGRFRDVTGTSGVSNGGFGQGVTVGDFDNDGFPDVYVANIRANVLYRNQGDGTFEDITLATGTAGDVWSLSAACADLNGDSLPDLYVVNYLGGPAVFSRVCQANGRPVQCPPGGFPAEPDSVFRNLGDGRFQDVTEEWGFAAPDGKGMGIIVADFDQSGRPQVFVANDTTANFLFVNEANDSDSSPHFIDQAALVGVAFNDVGNTRSSMGVACGDATGDGALDLLITNFIRESNSFQVRRPDGTFEDQVRQYGLREPSLDKMGWGTQFLDADADGLLDLAIANGHLDDYSASGVPFKMVTQVFRNRSNQRFDLVEAKRLGPYFSRQVLGRAMARLDWNRDGKEDLCVTHVDVPFALLSNTTASSGKSLVLSLRGTDSSRDAIGAIIRVVAGDRTITRQVIAGDGFAASNERKIVVGMGSADHASKVQVRWPSGKEQHFQDLSAEHEWVLLEGRSNPVAITRPSLGN